MSVFDRHQRPVQTPAPEPAPLPPTDVPHALGALLVRVAKSDNYYAFREIHRIDRILAQSQNIGPIDAAKLRAESERLADFAPDTSEFALYLCKAVSYEDRRTMVRALWDVVYADGVSRDSEEEVMMLTQTHLGIAPEHCREARGSCRSARARLSYGCHRATNTLEIIARTLQTKLVLLQDTV